MKTICGKKITSGKAVFNAVSLQNTDYTSVPLDSTHISAPTLASPGECYLMITIKRKMISKVSALESKRRQLDFHI